MIRTFTGSTGPELTTFVGVFLGGGLLLAAYLVPEWRLLAVPGLIALFPSLILGLR